MVTRQIRSTPSRASATRDFPRQVWLAGLGAVSLARKQSSKTFKRLVAEGEQFRGEASKFAQQLNRDLQRVAADLSKKANAEYAPLKQRVVRNLRATEKTIGAGADEALATLQSIYRQSRAEFDRVRDNAQARNRRAAPVRTARSIVLRGVCSLSTNCTTSTR